MLLDQETFDAFAALYKRCDEAYTEVWVGLQSRDRDPLTHANAVQAANNKLGQAKQQRAEVVRAMRKVIRRADPDALEKAAPMSPEQNALPPRG